MNHARPHESEGEKNADRMEKLPGRSWETEVNVRDFIQKNYHPYDGDDSFLEGPTQDTTDLWDQVLELSRQEREAGGVLDMDTKIISTITSHGPGYLDKEKEKIVGFRRTSLSNVLSTLRRYPYGDQGVRGQWIQSRS